MQKKVSDFTNGMKMPKLQVEAWHQKILEHLKSGLSEGPYTIASGNSLVMGTVVKYSHDPDNPVIVIYEVNAGYKEYKYSDFKSDQ